MRRKSGDRLMAFKSNTKNIINDEDRKKNTFLNSLAIVSTNEARAQSRVDTGLSKSSKFSTVQSNDEVLTQAPVEYDIYLEYRYGVMSKSLMETIKKIPTLLRKVFK